MGVILKKITQLEVIQLHDSYAASTEPDAPRMRFADLTDEEKQTALKHFSLDTHFTVCYNDEVIGYIGITLDGKLIDINIFAVILPHHRGKKYSVLALPALIEFCRSQYPEYKQIRSLTRKSNIPAIKGLKSLPFIYKGVHVEEYDQNPENDVEYEEYILPIKL
jgi:RimJ/RimL family protein N-acetyltransferase